MCVWCGNDTNNTGLCVDYERKALKIKSIAVYFHSSTQLLEGHNIKITEVSLGSFSVTIPEEKVKAPCS